MISDGDPRPRDDAAALRRGRAATRDAVIAGLDDHLRAVIAAKGLGDAGQVERAEAEVATLAAPRP